MVTRPSIVNVDTAAVGWDTPVEQNFQNILNGPFPLYRAADLATLDNDHPPDEFDDCLAITTNNGAIYKSNGTSWEVIGGSNVDKLTQSWAFATSSTGSYYIGGFYKLHSGNGDFSPAALFGSANSSYAAHFFVVLGETTDSLGVTIRVTGTSINDAGTRTTSDTEDIVIPNDTAANTYYETSKKWLGQVSVEAVSGTAKNCNYGYCKYWDAGNKGFTLIDFEALWHGGANDSSPDIILRHHQTTGWTYNAGSTPTPPTAITSLQAVHNTEYEVDNGEYGAFKRTAIGEAIAGDASEGLIIEVVAGAVGAFENGTASVTIQLDP